MLRNMQNLHIPRLSFHLSFRQPNPCQFMRLRILKFNQRNLLNLRFFNQYKSVKSGSIGQIAGKSISKTPMYTGVAIGSKL